MLLSILKANNQDVSVILKHSAAGVYESTGNTVNLPEEKVYAMFTSILEKGGYYLVAKEEDQIQGWILLGQNKDYFTDVIHGFIYDIFVLPEYRGKGLSKMLIQYGIEEFKLKGYEEISLNVFAANTAKELYKRLGFKETQILMKLSI
ncbi:GNAT family N-acetyltransferase [Bacillus cereus group sp. BfR-BA-01380]|uniref:GNAT family N-acetyltransferase n=1 Tax=Bacillus cereus group sp. BfR-BA-01380 TaxID=2920324 RepID=UPI001F5A0095|nr:GNAT family N-acetyltransferase [Bacillus cereus group sp. BfR-BA-01380]